MTTMQLNAEILRNLGYISENESSLQKVLEYVKNLVPQKKEDATTQGKYKFSPTVKELMGSIHIDPKHIENDSRMKYILEK